MCRNTKYQECPVPEVTEWNLCSCCCHLQEIAKKRAMGIPIDPDEESNEGNTDPFERMANVSDDEDDGTKEAVSWSYSQYIQAFDEEEVLNEVDEMTFSSLMSEEARLGEEGGRREIIGLVHWWGGWEEGDHWLGALVRRLGGGRSLAWCISSGDCFKPSMWEHFYQY